MSSAVVDQRVDSSPTAAVQTPPPAPATPTAPVKRSRGRTVAIQVLSALLILVVLALGFGVYLYGLSGLSEHRAQNTLRKSFAHQLAEATAPVGPVAQGTPVAVLSIPEIGLRGAVVVEGTSARDLNNGPGHAVSSVLPGQVGTSVIYARRATFGAPFSNLLRLQPGDRISVTAGQGVSTYRVSSFGTDKHPAPANSTNRLILVTADTGFWPSHYVSVSADLISSAQPTSGQTGMTSADQLPLARDVDGSLLPTLLWSQALLLVVIVGVVAFVRWKPLVAYLCVTPIAVAVLWSLYENLANLGPNLY